MKTNKTDFDSKIIFANNLKRYLQLTGKTQKEVAAAIGVTTGNFCDWMNCRSYPRMEKLQALADYFGIKKADLLDELAENEEDRADQEVLDLFHQVSKEKREFVLSMIRAAIDNL
jgi:transcriptional regulator with XRE-family HTH domain